VPARVIPEGVVKVRGFLKGCGLWVGVPASVVVLAVIVWHRTNSTRRRMIDGTVDSR
jgi:hypothetical protein